MKKSNRVITARKNYDLNLITTVLKMYITRRTALYTEDRKGEYSIECVLFYIE